MNPDMKHELESAIESDMSLMQIVGLLQNMRERGARQAEVYAFLESLHQSAPDEATDDRILEVADCVAGFCSPHMRIWNSEVAG